MNVRTVIVRGAVLGLLVLLPGDAYGQATAAGTTGDEGSRFYSSRYLSMGHWAYHYLDALIARGRLPDLSPLIQPYRRIDVAGAILRMEAEVRLLPEEREWLEPLKSEFDYEIDQLVANRPQEVSFRAETAVGLKGLSHTHRDLLRPSGTRDELYPTWELNFYGDAPFVAGHLWGRWDNHYLNDPQFPDGRAVVFRQCDPLIDECGYRVEEAYVELQTKYARLSFGRLYRNWGLPGTHGLLVSDYAYSYDHIGYRFGSERVSLSGMFAPLSDLPGDTAHYLSSHRFEWRIRDNLVFSASESTVWGGENRRVDFNLMNPVGVWEVSGGGGTGPRNALGLAELWWRPFANLLTYGAFMVDNTKVNDPGAAEGFTQYAAQAGLQFPAVLPRLDLRVDASVVNALAYRSRVGFFEYYTVDRLGLARDKTDAVVVSAQGDWFARRGLILRPQLHLMFRGEADLRDEFPPDAFDAGRDRLLVGTVETTIRPAVAGVYLIPPAEVRWDLGLNFIENREHQSSDWEVETVGRVRVELRHRF